MLVLLGWKTFIFRLIIDITDRLLIYLFVDLYILVGGFLPSLGKTMLAPLQCRVRFKSSIYKISRLYKFRFNLYIQIDPVYSDTPCFRYTMYIQIHPVYSDAPWFRYTLYIQIHRHYLPLPSPSLSPSPSPSISLFPSPPPLPFFISFSPSSPLLYLLLPLPPSLSPSSPPLLFYLLLPLPSAYISPSFSPLS